MASSVAFYRAKSCLFLLILLLFYSPIVVVVTLFLWMYGNTRRILQRRRVEQVCTLPQNLRRKILVIGGPYTKTLHVVRVLGKAGHRIIVVNYDTLKYPGIQWSRYVERVVNVPNLINAKENTENYVREVVKVAIEEKVDWYLPITFIEASVANTMIQERLALYCPQIKTFGYGDSKKVELLDNKITFLQKCRELGFCVVDSRTFRGVEELREIRDEGLFLNSHYFLKPAERIPFTNYRSIFNRIPHDTQAFNDYVTANEELLQFHNELFFVCEFIKGPEYSSLAICRDGKVLAFEVGPCSSVQLDYDAIEHPAIKKWTLEFCAKMNITGCISFDFLQDEKTGKIFCIECNPRLHSSFTTFDYDPRLVSVFHAALEPDSVQDKSIQFPIEPSPESPHVYWLYQEMYKLCTLQQGLGHLISVLYHGKEAVFNIDDPLVFLMYNTIQYMYPLSRYIYSGEPWNIVNPCLGLVK